MIHWLGERREDGLLHARVGRRGDELVAEWTNVVRMFVGRDGGNPRFEVFDDGVDSRIVNKIIQGAAKVLLRQLRGELGVHGAAVATSHGAVAFVGRSGAGKSTLAATLCLRYGASLLADDVIALDESTLGSWSVVPTESEHWLLPSSRRALGLSDGIDAKLPETSTAAAGAVALHSIYLVELGGEQMTTSSLAPASAFAELVPQLIRLVVDEPDAQRREFDKVSRLVETTSFYRLRQPNRLDSVDDTARMIIDR